MKTLIATAAGQDRPDDFHFTAPGELASPYAYECDDACQCGCARAFIGVDTRRGTTTAMVDDLPGVPNVIELARRLTVSADAAGFVGDPAVGLLQARELVAFCADLPVGTVVRRDGRDLVAYVPVEATR